MEKRIKTEDGIVCRLPHDKFGYFGWPCITRMDDGVLVVVASGMRYGHVDGFGRTTIQFSRDDGKTWSNPRVITDTPIDDRDAGVVNLGGKKLLVSWFGSDTRVYKDDLIPDQKTWIENWTDEVVDRYVGSWIKTSDDGGETWNEPVRVDYSAPKGPIRLQNGDLLYFGKGMRGKMSEWDDSEIAATISGDGGKTWKKLGVVPLQPETQNSECHEPHAVELPSGKLIGAIRCHSHKLVPPHTGFSILTTESEDGGLTWSETKELGFHGSPPHLMRHSSGVLILSYGYRQEPYGERIALSYDDGKTWDHDWTLRDDGPDGDLGYPATVELADGSLYTIYYQKYAAEEKCAILSSRWRLPDR